MTSPSAPCLITILKQFGWRVFIIRRRLSRLKTRIQRAEKKNQPTTTLESQQVEELSVDLERYEDLLNDCAKAIHDRTGIPTSKLVEVATSTTDGQDWDYIYAELKDLDERRVNAEVWKALLSRDPDALISVGLLPSSESSPAVPETENQGSKADDESGLTTMLSVGLLPSSESSPPAPEADRQIGKADDESDPKMTLDEFAESDYAGPMGDAQSAGAQHKKVFVPTNEDVSRVVNLVASGTPVQTAAKEIAKNSVHTAGSLKTMYYRWKQTAKK